MTPADLNTKLRTKPFVPFAVVTSDGTTCEVRHPELVVLTLGSAHIGYPAPGQQYVAERVDIVSMRHIIRLEELPSSTATSQGNGES